MRRAIAVTAAACLTAIGLGTATPASAGTGATTITFTVTGCEGCTIQAFQADIKDNKTYQGDPTKVKNGVATMGVPTAKTRGMYFSIMTPKVARINAQPLITVQYKGVAPGATVTKAHALAAKSGTACWAGTTQGTATISVEVERVIMASFPNAKKKTSVPLAFFQPSAKGYGGFGPPYKGVLATQDVWACGPGSAKYH